MSLSQFPRYFRRTIVVTVAFWSLAPGCSPGTAETGEFSNPEAQTIQRIQGIPAPPGYSRIKTTHGFALFLRNLRLLPSKTVYLYNGKRKGNQEAHFRIVDLSVGKKDLQQCADALIRIRSEYFWHSNQKEKISFHFTSGDVSSYSKWRDGFRPAIRGSKVSFQKTEGYDASYGSFFKYLENLFTYAGTISLKLDSKPVTGTVSPGDFFLESGSPGHAIMILDIVEDPNGKRLYLLGQSYMPAQQFHVLRNPLMPGEAVPGYERYGNVWYDIDPGKEVRTPEWVFPANALRRWK
ncbi:MAG: hypothetical protein CMF59_07240 [Leptospiraceae bacterium]|nr:hypothetical protein [Leptospiraceae bacterium]